MPKKLIIIDASSLNSAGCLRKYYLAHVLGYRAKGPNSVQIEYGSAVHVFKEVLKKYGDANLAMACAQQYFKDIPKFYPPKKEWYTLVHLTETCILYLETKHEQDNFVSLRDEKGRPLVEQTVSIPYYQNESCEILLAGTMDDIGRIKGGCFLVDDTKTTGAWNKAEYFQGYELNHQLMFYRLIIDWLAENLPDSIWGTMKKGQIGLSVNVAFLSATKPTEFERSKIKFYSEGEMAEFKGLVDSFIHRLLPWVDSESTGMPAREGLLTQACQGRFDNGKCQFFQACAAPDEIATGHIIRHGFDQKVYDPLGFRKLPEAIEKMIENYTSKK